MPSSLWPLAAVASVAVVAIVAKAFRKSRKHRDRSRDLPASRESPNDDRLERLEHVVETIALETERIGEGQRFVTKILVERGDPDKAAPVKKAGSE